MVIRRRRVIHDVSFEMRLLKHAQDTREAARRLPRGRVTRGGIWETPGRPVPPRSLAAAAVRLGWHCWLMRHAPDRTAA